MSLAPPNHTDRVLGVRVIVIKSRTSRRKNKRRLIESVAQDWENWDAAASRAGLNFCEFARRALNLMTAQQDLFESRKRLK